jgi:hypothetical protein
MSKLASNDIMEQLHAAVAKALFKRIEDGEATAADLAAAAKFLKDNGVSRLLDKSLNDEGEAVTGNIPDPQEDPGDFENVVSLYQ